MASSTEPNVHTEVSVEADVDFSGSDYSSATNASSTDSLASSLNNYMEENGRRYHSYYGTDKNLMPTDELEQDRLDIHHEIMLLVAKNSIYRAPIKNPHRILDLGTGTGIWCVDAADLHPEAEVIGTDLSLIQPKWVPPNCKFEIDDMELDWTYKPNSFDFIHARNIFNSVKDYTKLMSEIYTHLQPGGYVELAELGFEVFCDDGTMPEDWPPKTSFALACKAIEASGRMVPTGEKMAKMLSDAGFVDVEVEIFKQPFGTWPKNKELKHAGALFLLGAETAYHSYGLALLTRFLGMTLEEATAICDAGRDATLYRARKLKVHDYNHYYVVYARKPLE